MYGPFEEETAADLVVNVIPIGIVLFFVGLIFLFNPWEWDPWVMTVVFVLHAVPVIGLVIISYASGIVVQRDEETSHGETDARVEEEPPAT